MLSAMLQGAGLGGGLIVAIGAQNAHVLRTGLQRRHVVLTVATCIVVDVLLITAGLAGLGTLIERSPVLLALARWGGVLFLGLYALQALRRALARHALAVSATAPAARSAAGAFAAVLAVSLLNPHVYLDTVVLLGAVGAQQPVQARAWFGAGAAAASVLWFSALGGGARLLSPWFARPAAWHWLDAGVAVVMASLAVALALAPLRPA